MNRIEVLVYTIDNYESVFIQINRYITEILHESEQDKFKSLFFNRDKVNFFIARSVIKSKYRYLKEKFNYSSNGKPFIDEEKFFNLSHTEGMVAIAFSEKCEIGVDVEKMIDQNFDAMQRIFASNKESDYIKSSETEKKMRFYRIWTLKEAYLKAKGMGITDNLNSLNVFDLESNKYATKFINNEAGEFCLSIYADHKNKMALDIEVKINHYESFLSEIKN